MTEQNKFSLGKAPFIRRADHTQSTSTMMRDFIIALIPLIIFAWVKNGLLPFINGDTKNIGDLLYPLILVFLGGFTSVLSEFIYFKFIKKSKQAFEDLRTSFAVIPGLLLGMLVPLHTPIWLVILGALVATVIGKLVFGGFGRNIFNPALVGYVFISTAYMGVITAKGGALNATESASNLIKAVSGATPMTHWSSNIQAGVDTLMNPYGNLWDFFLGTVPGALAETSALLCILAGVFLIVRKVINWRTPVFFVGTVFVLSYIIGAVNGHATDLRYPLYAILSGGLLFGAVFMATEPVTSPRTPNGKIIYAIALGVLTVLFRFKSNLPEGVATAILTMNLFVVIIDTLAAKLRVTRNLKKVVFTYSLIGLLLAGISVYAITSTISSNGEQEEEIEIVLKNQYQDYDDLNFVFLLDVEGENVIVKTDALYNILSINLEKYNTDDVKDSIKSLVRNKIITYISKIEKVEDEIIFDVISRGYSGNLTHKITVDLATYKITKVVLDFANESYNDIANEEPPVEDPKVEMAIRIIAGQEDLSKVNPVSGATVSSNSAIFSAKAIVEYINIVFRGIIVDKDAELVYVSHGQDINSLAGFKYVFGIGRTKITVNTDENYNITSISNDEVNTDEYKNKFNDIIKIKKVNEKIQKAEVSGSEVILTIATEGYNGTIITKITIDSSTLKITNVDPNLSGETYDAQENPKVEMPNRIIIGQDDLNKINPVSGATVSSKAVIKAAKLAQTYINEVLK